MPPPFNINETSPAPSALISAFPADEQSNRAEIEEWLTFISDPATGLIRESVLPPAGVFFASGTKMLFVQTAAPTGWTKDITHNNKALRIVNGAAGTGGTVTFTNAFTSQAVAGTNASTTATGTIGNTTDTGTVGATTLTTAQIPSHSHSFSGTSSTDGAHTHTMGPSIDVDAPDGGTPIDVISDVGGAGNSTNSAGNHNHTFSGTTGTAGSGNSHTHTDNERAYAHVHGCGPHSHLHWHGH